MFKSKFDDAGEVGAGFFAAFGHRAHALADFQADVPQQRQKTLDGIAKISWSALSSRISRSMSEVGVQLAAAVAADHHQGDIGVFAPTELFPGLLQDVIDEPGAVLDQPTDVGKLWRLPILPGMLSML